MTGVAATLMLRRSWRCKGGIPEWRAAGLILLAAGLVLPAFLLGEARGPFMASALLSTAALAGVASGAIIRAPRTARVDHGTLAPEPAERPSARWRGVLRWLLAGPIGMIAAMALGICYAVWAPGEAQTRLVTGAIIVPFAWAGAMAWTLADAKVLRATAVLVGTAIAGFALAIVRGFA